MERKTLAAWRRERDITQQELARMVGLKQSHLSAYESCGRPGFSPRSKAALARVLGVSTDDVEWELAQVYLVVGRTGDGDYEPREWFVGAYLSPGQAEDHVARANAWLTARGLHTSSAVPPAWYVREAAVQDGCPFDPCFQTDSGGTCYQLVTTPLLAKAPAEISVIFPGITPAVVIREDAEPHVAGAAIT